MNSLKLKLVILACIIMSTANSFTNTNNSTKVEKTSVEVEKTLSDKNENSNSEKEDKTEESAVEEVKSPTKYSQRDDNIIDINSLVHE